MSYIYRKLCQAEIVLSGLCLITSVVLIFLQAILRTLDHPINWGLYIALFLFTWSTFLAADVAYRNNATVFVDVFTQKMPVTVQKWLRLACYLISIAFMLAMIVYGCQLFEKSWVRPYQGLTWMSYSWVALSIPVGFSLMLMTTIRKIYYEFIIKEEPPVVDLITGRKKKEEEQK